MPSSVVCLLGSLRIRINVISGAQSPLEKIFLHLPMITSGLCSAYQCGIARRSKIQSVGANRIFPLTSLAMFVDEPGESVMSLIQFLFPVCGNMPDD